MMGTEIESKFLHSASIRFAHDWNFEKIPSIPFCRQNVMGTEGIEPPSSGLEPDSLPLAYAPLRSRNLAHF